MSRLVAIALATWRLSYMLVHERGPFAIFQRLRDSQVTAVPYPQTTYHEDGNEFLSVSTISEFGQLLACVFCLSVWIAPVLLILDQFVPRINDALAVSAGALLVDRGINS